MKKALLLLALVQGVALSAFAQTPADTAKTRTEVKADTKAAAKAGEIKSGDVAVTAPTAPAASTKTRADVKADTKAAAKAGDIKTGDIAPGVVTPMPVVTDTKTRAEVKADAKAANKAGEVRKNGDIGEQPAPVVKKRMKKMKKMAKPAVTTDAAAPAPAK